MERRPHPSYPQLQVQRDGRIFDKYWQADTQAYLIFRPPTGKQTYYAAGRFVFEAYNGLVDESKQVYFLNNDFEDRALTNLIAMTPDERKEGIAKRLQEELGGKHHPKYTDLVGFSDGRVFSLSKEKFNEGYKKTTGYMRYGQIEGQKLIYECFNGLVNGRTLHVDHKNNIHDDNRLENLQLLTRKEHLEKDV